MKPFVVLLFIVILGSVARADEIPTVKVSDVGPDQPFPTDKSFYVAGDPGKNTTGVQVTIVKKGNASLFGGNGPSCSALADALHTDAPTVKPLDPGVTQVFKQFPAAAPEFRDDDVLVSGYWDASKNTDQTTFKVLVSTNSGFFYPGYAYCVYILKKTQQVDTTTIEKLVEKFAVDSDACEPIPPDPRLPAPVPAVPTVPPPTKEAIAAAIATCQNMATTALEAGVDAFAKKAFPEASAQLPDCAAPATAPAPAAGSGSGAGSGGAAAPAQSWEAAYCKLRSDVHKAAGLARGITSGRNAAVAAARNSNRPLLAFPPGWLGLNDELGHAIITALTRHGALFEQRRPSANNAVVDFFIWLKLLSPTVRIDHVMPGGEFAVGAVQILDDGLTIRVAQTASSPPAKQKTLEHVTTSDIVIADGVTLYDLVALSRGRFPADKASTVDVVPLLTAVTLAQPLDPAFGVVGTKAGALAKLFDPGSEQPEEETDPAMTYHVKRWLAEASRVPANKSAKQWLSDLDLLALQKPRFDAELPNLKHSMGVVTTLGGPKAMPLQIGMTEDTWVFAYLTPMVGYAQIDSKDGWFSFPYAGVQLHVYPNPANDPLWNHGFARDVRRALALELAVGARTSGFGPDSRYRGALGLPPPTVALAIHVIPYTSLSLGVAFLERRETVLPIENPHSSPTFFVGLSVQANIPDFVKKQSMTTTTVTAK